jgi:DNA-binding protein HU-beta
VALTQTQLVAAVADRTELSKADAKRVLAALEDVVLKELGNAQKVRIGGLVQLTVRVKPVQKKRKGRNPATGEAIEIAAKSASVDRSRPAARSRQVRAALGAAGAPAPRGLNRRFCRR